MTLPATLALASRLFPTFNPFDKIIELNEALVKSEKKKVEILQRVIDKWN